MIETRLGICAQGLRFRRDSGCDHCLSAPVSSLNGTHGRTVVAEMIEPVYESVFLDGLKRHDGLGLYEWFHARPRSNFSDPDMHGKTAMQCAIYKMSQGLIDPRHVESKFGSFDLITQGNRPRV